MGGAGRGSRRGSDRSPADPPTDAQTNSSRSALDLFVLTQRHAEQLAELASLRPDLATRLDLRLVEPGSESIESLSARAHEWLVDRGFDFAVFRLLCDLNSDRIAAELAFQVDEQGFPCDEQELVDDAHVQVDDERRATVRRIHSTVAPKTYVAVLSRHRRDDAVEKVSITPLKSSFMNSATPLAQLLALRQTRVLS